MKRIFDTQTMQVMRMFEQITHANLKDCFTEDEIQYFIVEEHQIGKAVGKQGRNLKKLEKALKRKVKIVEYSSDLATFVRNLYYPTKIEDIVVEEETVTIMPADLQARGYLIGRGANTLRRIERIVQRYFDIKEIKIAPWSKKQEA
ncbi:NusA-like transcription termination signal-binding factor [Candidatus Woesearchaeota archaeon]|nr:NusA-like transcription termination signal-binding factor [Candidatus Woesearchaeota archaeon]